MAPKATPIPRGTGASGRKLWRSVLDIFKLEEQELVRASRADCTTRYALLRDCL
jgi:hypothetical protein